MLMSEQYGAREDSVRMYRFERSPSALRKLGESPKSVSFSANVGNFFRDVFLPQGFPESVTEDYLEYQLWDTIQAFASSITGTLATEAVLKGVGVGDKNATALAATVTWLLKDGTGMVGRILFAWARGTELDCDSKRWRLFADLLNDAAILTDLLAPAEILKPFFTYVVCVSSFCRSLVGVAGGATRAALTQHQARRNNLADVSAKDGSQETLVNLSALLCSLLLIQFVSGKPMLVWLLFFVFTGLHLFANYRAVRALRMDTLNLRRFQLVARHYFETGRALDVATTNRREPLLFSLTENHYQLGCSLQELFHLSGGLDCTEFLRLFADNGFLINVARSSGKVNVSISLMESSGTECSVKLQCLFCAEHFLYSFPGTLSTRFVSYFVQEWIISCTNYRAK